MQSFLEHHTSLWAIGREVFSNLLGFFLPGRRTSTSLTLYHRRHALLSAFLYGAMFFVDGLMFHRVYQVASDQRGLLLIGIATLLVFLATLFCYALPEPLMERERKQAWIYSIAVQAAAALAAGLLFGQLVPPTPLDTGVAYDWPPSLAIFKDLTIFWVFGFIYLTNFFCFVLAVQFLNRRRQFYTVRRCLAGDEEALGMLPSTLLHIPFKWAVVVAACVAVLLLIFELDYYGKLDQAIPQNAWIIGMGILRDAIFIILAFETFAWYRLTSSTTKREVWDRAQS